MRPPRVRPVVKRGIGARRRWLVVLAVVSALVLPYGYQALRPLPAGLSFEGPARPVANVEFLYDLTSVDVAGEPRYEQAIFDAVLAIVGNARRFIVLDMFLYNPYIGSAPEPLRDLSEELTAALIARRDAVPEMPIIVITDPVNTVYGGAESRQFERLREHGIDVVITRLDALRDSNAVYSFFWRIFIRPFGDARGDTLPNPFSDGRVSLRSYLRLLNFKANHRKTIVADDGGGLAALVTSANPHDGSSAHTNVALRFDGPAALDLLETENGVLELSGHARFEPSGDFAMPAGRSGLELRVVTEKKIKHAVIDAIETASPGDGLRLAMFYLSDRDIVGALERAGARGVETRVLLDPNKDAFGRKKNGVPARPVAAELTRAGLPLRWCDTHGEQCHIKLLLVDYASGTSTLIAGSANYTRRNLEDFNLETDVAIKGPSGDAVFADARELFDLMWRNGPERQISTEYATYADESVVKRLLYRFMEASGISTF